MQMQKYIETVLAPKIQGDGGWIEFVDLKENELTVVFRGECSQCMILHRCVDWIEQQIQTDLHKTVRVHAIRKKPYFQDV